MAGTVVKSLRVDPALWARVEALAAERGVKAVPLVVGFIEQGLAGGGAGGVVVDRPAPGPRPRTPPPAVAQAAKVVEAQQVLQVAEADAAHLGRSARQVALSRALEAVGSREEPKPVPGSRLKKARRF